MWKDKPLIDIRLYYQELVSKDLMQILCMIGIKTL